MPRIPTNTRQAPFEHDGARSRAAARVRGLAAGVLAAAIACTGAEASTPCQFRGLPVAEDTSACFVGAVPDCGHCESAWNFAADMLMTGYVTRENGQKDYLHEDASVLVANGYIERVSGLPADLFVRGADVHVDFAVERKYLHPPPEAPTVIRTVIDSDLFAWRDSGMSRYAFRQTVLPFAHYHFRAIRDRIRTLEERALQPLDWQAEPDPPQVYSWGDYRGDVPPEESVLATSLPRLRAISTWLESTLPPGLDKHLSEDGKALNQPPDVRGRSYPGVALRSPAGGGFHDRSGALQEGDKLLLVFRQRDVVGDIYRLSRSSSVDPTWKVFWGTEKETVEAVLEQVTACAAKRMGASMLIATTDALERTTLQETLAACYTDLSEARLPL